MGRRLLRFLMPCLVLLKLSMALCSISISITSHNTTKNRNKSGASSIPTTLCLQKATNTYANPHKVQPSSPK